jgi:hypothetical protein
MSWKVVNKILGLAMTDKFFAEKLLHTPQEALDAYGIVLPENELRILCNCQARTLQELSLQLMEKLDSENEE